MDLRIVNIQCGKHWINTDVHFPKRPRESPICSTRMMDRRGKTYYTANTTDIQTPSSDEVIMRTRSIT